MSEIYLILYSAANEYCPDVLWTWYEDNYYINAVILAVVPIDWMNYRPASKSPETVNGKCADDSDLC